MRLPSRSDDPADKALRARMLEIDGRQPEAIDLLSVAAMQADRNLDLPSEVVAWFHVRLGDSLAAAGRDPEATAEYRRAVAVFPGCYKALFGLASVAQRRSDLKQAEQWASRAVEIVPAPEAVALLADTYSALGRRDDARRQYAVVDAIAHLSRAQGVVYDRQRALYYADHGVHLDDARALARRELLARHDIYAYDTLAWVCFRAGRIGEAGTYMAKATARGTKDVRLARHARAIAGAQAHRAAMPPNGPSSSRLPGRRGPRMRRSTAAII